MSIVFGHYLLVQTNTLAYYATQSITTIKSFVAAKMHWSLRSAYFLFISFAPFTSIAIGRHDTLLNDIQHNDTQHNDVQHNNTQHYGAQLNDTQHDKK